LKTIDKEIKIQLIKIRKLKEIVYSMDEKNQLNGSELN